MVPGQRLLLIVAADRHELAALDHQVRSDLDVRWAADARIGESEALLAANGPGRENAAAAVERIAGRFRPAAVVSAGYAGGLDPALQVGEVVIPRSVRMEGEGVEYPVSSPIDGSECGRGVGPLLTIDRVAQTPSEKARLLSLGADIVDMEAAAVAAAAERLSLPFFCIRAVSDAADAEFAFDFNRARRPDGTFSGWNLVSQAGLSPDRWKRLLELKRDGDAASRNLARCLSRCRFLRS